MRPRVRRGAALAAALFTIAACGGSDSDDDPAADVEDETEDDGPVITRPRPTAPAGTAPPVATTTELLNLLPKAGDIGALELGIPAVAAIRSMAVEVSQDPKGPCGATLELPSLEGAAGRTFDTVKGRIVAIVVPRDPTVDAYVEANRADLTVGCPSHTTTIADGSEVTLSAPTPIDVTATTPDGFGWISTVEQPAAGGSHTTLLLPSTDVTVMVTMTSPEVIEPAFAETLAEVYFAKVSG